MTAGRASSKVWQETVALVAAAVLTSILVAPALGQGTSPAAPGSAPCSPLLPPGSPGTVTTSEGKPLNPATPPEDLSKRLAQSDGVICPPPGIDPEIRLPTPDTGRTPVIPPPGSPGGDPSIRPK